MERAAGPAPGLRLDRAVGTGGRGERVVDLLEQLDDPWRLVLAVEADLVEGPLAAPDRASSRGAGRGGAASVMFRRAPASQTLVGLARG
jgi:hypothetical protein